jgi:hypothetical protein
MDAALEPEERIGEEVVGAEKVAPHADRPGGGSRRAPRDCSISSNRSNGSRLLAVELVDKGDDRHVAQPAHLEKFAGLLLDAPLCAIGAASSGPLPNPPPASATRGEGGVGDRGQGAVGVLAEVPMG